MKSALNFVAAIVAVVIAVLATSMKPWAMDLAHWSSSPLALSSSNFASNPCNCAVRYSSTPDWAIMLKNSFKASCARCTAPA